MKYPIDISTFIGEAEKIRAEKISPVVRETLEMYVKLINEAYEDGRASMLNTEEVA